MHIFEAVLFSQATCNTKTEKPTICWLSLWQLEAGRLAEGKKHQTDQKTCVDLSGICRRYLLVVVLLLSLLLLLLLLFWGEERKVHKVSIRRKKQEAFYQQNDCKLMCSKQAVVQRAVPSDFDWHMWSWLVSWCFEPSQPQRITSGPDIRGQSRMRLSFYVKPLISKHPARWLGLVQCTFNSLSCSVFWRKQFWLFVKFLLVQTNIQTHLHM